MHGFSSYNQIHICYQDQYKTTFTTPWGTLSYHGIHFVLKNIGTTIQHVMSYAFHDLVHTIISFLDDLIIKSQNQSDHLIDLDLIFL